MAKLKKDDQGKILTDSQSLLAHRAYLTCRADDRN